MTDVVADNHEVTMPAIAEVRQATYTGLTALGPEPGATVAEVSTAWVYHMIESLEASTINQTRAEQAALEFARGAQSIPSVVAVSHAKDGNVCLVWTFVRDRNKESRRQVYAYERRLMERYPELLFDFNVVALDRAAGVLAPDDLQGRLVFYRDL